ncbi:DUF1801 domain-containing protein [Microbacterium thalassium]|uniref:DUF1801 domain-containing protein n=1 Tax=Microbacterium thalassium TaxID=362649 RepID=A0A7X0FME3_9MICO|nr:DUF1801 domain-containing protein [Microbacterium thalassium]MBB6390177.1 hypothetical protein [Microbacterium thalassium]GLK25285.1 hypothetical protein GCM10017607_26040 [Microbacterium thalassium]
MEMVNDDVDEFLDETARSHEMRALDRAITEALPGLTRVLWRGTMWGGTEQAIIGYGLIVQPRPRGADVEWFLVGLAEQKRHLSIYVNAADSEGYLVQRHAYRLGAVRVGAAAITFTAIDRLDLEEFRTMLQRARELMPDAR